MKTISSLFWINLVWILFTLGMFTTFTFGLVAELVLGFIQLISSLILIAFWKRLNSYIKWLYVLYWVLVTVYFSTFWSFDGFLDFDQYMDPIISAATIPMTISLYFLFVLFTIRREFKSKKTSNNNFI
jgi:hypothetical protein